MTQLPPYGAQVTGRKGAMDLPSAGKRQRVRRAADRARYFGVTETATNVVLPMFFTTSESASSQTEVPALRS